MINDSKTNFLYLADTLPKKHPQFYKRFHKVLHENKVKFALLPDTKDIWARDYMPIKNSLGDFINFKYQPDYLKSKKYESLITDVELVCSSIKIPLLHSDINLDGGNVIHYSSKVIMCDRVLKENPGYSKKELIEQLRWMFRAKQIIFIPTAPDDLFGHADGVVRFVKSNLVLINKYGKYDKAYEEELKHVLSKAKLKYIELPYNPYNNKTELDASSIYLNYLQMKGIIFVPVYGLKEDNKAIAILKSVFTKEKIIQVKSNEIAKQGGVLNCISWNIRH